MYALDLAVVIRHAALWDALRDAFDTWQPEASDDGIEREGIGLIKPDFGPGYRIRARMHDGDAAGLAAWIDALQPPYTIGMGLASGVPGKQLGLGDLVISKDIPGFDWTARVGRGAGSGAEPEARGDGNLLRGALGLDAVDQRWTRQDRAPRPAGIRAPRLMAGGIASTLDRVPPTHGFDEGQTRAIGRRWPKLVAVERDGLDLATTINRSRIRPRVALVVTVTDMLAEPPTADADAVRYAVSNAVSFLRCWVRHAWPTRPVSAATGQTPKGVRLGDEAVARRSTTDSLPRVERVSGRAVPAPRQLPSTTSQPAPTGDEGIHIVDANRGTARRGIPRPRSAARPGAPEPGPGQTSGAVSLRARLARLYPTVADARRVLHEAGLPESAIDAVGSADARWYKILQAARLEPDGVGRLLRVLDRHGH